MNLRFGVFMSAIQNCQSWEEMLPLLHFSEDDSGTGISTELEIREFEQAHNILFPPDYKEFCQLFGTGVAGIRQLIYCPPTKQLLQVQEGLEITANSIREFPSRNPVVDQQKIAILENGFTFADDMGSCMLVWDLRTYRPEDSSYDIYWAVWDCPDSEVFEEDFKFVGRSFFEFIRDYCYGPRMVELYDPDDSCLIELTYHRLKL